MYDDLTQRQIAIVEYIARHLREKGFPPAYDDICNALVIRSKSTVSNEIHKLIKLDYLTMDPKAYRSLGLSDTYLKALAAENNDEEIEGSTVGQSEDLSIDYAPHDDEREDVMDIPIYGRVAAGSPIFAEDHIENTIPLPSAFLRTGNDYFILTVSGESMIEAGIFDGDQLIVKRQQTARNGEQVVALIEDEATVKTFFQRSGYVELRPENSSMEPIIVNDCTILGVVSGLYRIY